MRGRRGRRRGGRWGCCGDGQQLGWCRFGVKHGVERIGSAFLENLRGIAVEVNTSALPVIV